ncbi:hypothetical protein GCM10025858_19850 [Alicyclobacillus sacchari]|nr:hypothetical protein GCM10025858_19850 [Alicyclobacillus sacchari]
MFSMQVGLIGLGKMGHNLALNMMDHNHKVVAFDLDKNAVARLAEAGATPLNRFPIWCPNWSLRALFG